MYNLWSFLKTHIRWTLQDLINVDQLLTRQTFGMLSVISTKTQFKLYHKRDVTGSYNWDMRVSYFWNDWMWGLLHFFSLFLCYWLYYLLLLTGSSIEAGKATGDPDFLFPKSRERYLFYFCTYTSVPKRPCNWLCWSRMPALGPASVGRRMGSVIGPSLGRMLIPVLRWDTAL